MEYLVKLHTVNQEEFYIDHNIITNSELNLETFTFNFNSINIKSKMLDVYKQFRGSGSALIYKIDYFNPSFVKIYFTENVGLATNSFIWINDELLRNAGSIGGSSSDYIYERGVNGTRKQRHVSDNLITCWIDGRPTPLGIELDITDTDDGKIVYKGFITKIAHSGAAINLSISELINKLKKQTTASLWHTDDKMESELGNGKYIDYKSAIENNAGFNGLINFNNIVLYPKIEEIETFPLYYDSAFSFSRVVCWSYLSLVLKSNLVGISWNKETEKYETVRIDSMNIFNSVETGKEVDRLTNHNGGYTITLNELLADVDITYTKDKIFKIGGSIFGGRTDTRKLKIDISKLFLTDDEAINIAREFLYIYGLSLGNLEVTVLNTDNFVRAGKFYTCPDEYKQFLQDGDYILQCIAYSDRLATFNIIKESAWNPIAPEIEIYYIEEIASGYVWGWNNKEVDLFSIDHDADGNLDSIEREVVFFEVNDYVSIEMWSKNYEKEKFQILEIYNNNRFKTNKNVGIIRDTSEKYLMTYPKISDANITAKQASFSYENQGEV